jgi:hypothetical protein
VIEASKTRQNKKKSFQMLTPNSSKAEESIPSKWPITETLQDKIKEKCSKEIDLVCWGPWYRACWRRTDKTLRKEAKKS